MITQQIQLEEKLRINGWRIVARETSNLDWWADEIWTTESVWSPVGLNVYLTFLVDPQCEPDRKKGEDVWAIGVSIDRPTAREEGVEALIPLKPKWEKRFQRFIDDLNRIRDAH